jgi:hypothetical protein
VDQLAWMVKRAGVLAGGSLQVAGHQPARRHRQPDGAGTAAVADRGRDRAGRGGRAADHRRARARELLEQLDAVCPGGLQAPAGGSLQVAVTTAAGASSSPAPRWTVALVGVSRLPVGVSMLHLPGRELAVPS